MTDLIPTKAVLALYAAGDRASWAPRDARVDIVWTDEERAEGYLLVCVHPPDSAPVRMTYAGVWDQQAARAQWLIACARAHEREVR